MVIGGFVFRGFRVLGLWSCGFLLISVKNSFFGVKCIVSVKNKYIIFWGVCFEKVF